MCRDCSCWEDGYDEGRHDERKRANGIPPGISEREVAFTLQKAARMLYQADPLSVLALDCDQFAEAIIDHTPAESYAV